MDMPLLSIDSKGSAKKELNFKNYKEEFETPCIMFKKNTIEVNVQCIIMNVQ